MSASSSMTRSSRRRRRARRGEPSQSPSVTALPKGEPLASRSWSCWTSKVLCNRERPGSAVSIHGSSRYPFGQGPALCAPSGPSEQQGLPGLPMPRPSGEVAVRSTDGEGQSRSRFTVSGGHPPLRGDGAVLPTAAAVHPPPSPVLRPAVGPRGGGGRPVRWRGTAQSTALYNPARQTPPSLSGWG